MCRQTKDSFLWLPMQIVIVIVRKILGERCALACPFEKAVSQRRLGRGTVECFHAHPRSFRQRLAGFEHDHTILDLSCERHFNSCNSLYSSRWTQVRCSATPSPIPPVPPPAAHRG